MPLLVLLAAVLLAKPAFAADPPLVVAPFPKEVELSRVRIINALCRAVQCVPQGKVVRRGRVDFSLAKASGIGAVLSAKAKKRAGNRLFITLTLQDTNERVAFEREYRAPDGVMLEEDLASARDAILLDLLRASPQATTGAPRETAPESDREIGAAVGEEAAESLGIPEPEARERELLPEEAAALREAQEESAYSFDVGPEATADEALADENARPQKLLLDYGLDFFGRRFRWVNLTRGELLPYSADFIVAPRLGLIARPFLLIPGAPKLPVTISVEAAYRFALGLVTRTENSVLGRATGLTQFDLNLGVGWSPAGARQYVLTGVLGYRGGHFDVAPGATGDRLREVPKFALQQLRIAGRLEYVFENQARLQGELALLPVLGAADVISPDYFLTGGGTGFEAVFGGFYPVHPIVDMGALFTLTRVGLTLNNGAEADFQAEGALEQHVGGSLVIRVRL